MPANYTGNRYSTQSPSSPPAPLVTPVASLPVDADALNAASVYQMLKVNTDFNTYQMYAKKLVSEFWNYLPTVSASLALAYPSLWDFSNVATNDANISAPSASYAWSSIEINCALSFTYFNSAHAIIPPLTLSTLAMVMEFDAGVSAALDNTDVAIGFASDVSTNPTAGAAGAWFEILTGSGVWTARTKAASVSTVVNATPVAPTIAARPTQAFRLEVFGSGIYGGSNTVNFYCDGTLIGSSTTHISALPQYVFFRLSESIASHHLYIGPVTVTVF